MSKIVKCDLCGLIMLNTEPVYGGEWGNGHLCYRCYAYAEGDAERQWQIEQMQYEEMCRLDEQGEL